MLKNSGDIAQNSLIENSLNNTGSQHSTNNDDDLETQQHFFDIINTFKYYKAFNLKKVHRKLEFIANMNDKYQGWLKNYTKHLEQVQVAIMHNYEIIKLIIEDSKVMFKNATYLQSNIGSLVVKPEKLLNVSRIDSILHQIVREWSEAGTDERNSCYILILKEIENHFPDFDKRHQIRVLVPGAGLGRLPYEIAKRGFSSQGNEFSLLMLIVANFILNKTTEIELYQIYPWISQNCNNFKSQDQLLKVKFPDIDPSSIPKNVEFSMIAGSFIEIFNLKDHETYECIATCYFLDTAQNIVTYIETIWNILKHGGIWVNFGPLLYHYAEISEQNSIEPSYEVVCEIIRSVGFKILKEKTNFTSYYTKNPNSMASMEYHSVFFVCLKE